ncbi:lysophospholipid acyltransferase family protein [Microlunatus soli]|uniref:1-acyl-sn-glycerol-3-phosphate acyltransferase n=1 Tax=Microlunatus soli TaxID=630515 RepID=A0A1H2A6B6_9ACTN|nr:lysophospholipid acyltransferase family protein [Microlunatus soli]SDT41454.1 1-acyl-sn-glycerol-3-phosphate acyltransferase [Microlunatus soli]
MRTPARIADPVRRILQAMSGRPLLAARIRLEVGDRSAITEPDRPMVIVANHASGLDSQVLRAALPPRLRRRTTVAAGSQSPDAALAGGRSVLIFPEQERSTDGVMGAFTETAAALAIRHRAPVLPVGIRGTYAVLPSGRTWPPKLPFGHVRPRVSVRFGSVLHADPDETASSFTDRISDAVRTAIAEDRTTWWQSLRHGHDAATLPPAGSWRRIWEQSQSPRPGGQPRRPRIWKG